MNKTSKYFLRTGIGVRFAVPVLSLLIPIAHTSHILDRLADKGRYITSSPQTRTQPLRLPGVVSQCVMRRTRVNLQGNL